MEVWRFIQNKLKAGVDVILLWVIESEGSSPGRRGFKMAVSSDGDFEGTIGGGIMEHKLVEKARALLVNGSQKVTLIRQHHDKQHAKDQSGMICSGSQLIAFVPLNENHFEITERVLAAYGQHSNEYLLLSNQGIRIDHSPTHGLQFINEEQWHYAEKIDERPVIHIIGGGHVGLALSEMMLFVGFYVKVYDNRQNLHTMKRNTFAHEKQVVDYDQLHQIIPSSANDYVVIMTFGYRDDKVVLQQLLDKEFFYNGMMGSENKINQLVSELMREGTSGEQLKTWHMPIGINIFSKTTKEIAVSIAAEIIQEKNKWLPTGRTTSTSTNESNNNTL